MNIIRISEEGIETAVRKAAEVLSRGGIVLFPTDTLYGLAVDARNPDAVARLIALKGRDAAKAISVILPNVETISAFAEVIPVANRLIEKNLPGPLTLVLPLRDEALSHLAPDGTIGIRIPDDTFTLALGHEFNTPYTATSANVSGQPTLRSIFEILAQFGEAADDIDLIIDDGPRAGGVPSTVVRIVGEKIEILREGTLSAKALRL